MLVPVSWIREYTEFDLSVECLAEKLTMAGLEVEEIRDVAGEPVFSTYVTPNRPDLLSVVGVARDVSALLGTSFRMPSFEIREGNTDVHSMAAIEISSPENCPRYSARVITGVRVQESPEWIKARLTAGGLRPINNVVDATNYVLLELGQPLHAFDYDLLSQHRIVVRQAARGETIVSLDGEERSLSDSNLVIADALRPVAVAGVMGGLESEVTEKTTTVLLESAWFNRLSIRRTARALQMNTEASYRFERGVDPSLTVFALDRVAQLVQETGGGEIARGVIDVFPGRQSPLVVPIRPSRASMILGFEVTEGQITDYLTRLGMQVVPWDGRLNVTVPAFRPDVTREEDLIEEVGRIYGYERIPEALPCGQSLQGSDSQEGSFASVLSGILSSAGLEEVVTGSMTCASPLVDQVDLRNPLSDELCQLRSNLLLDLLTVLSYNQSRGVRDAGIYQIGRIFDPSDDALFVEKLSIAAAVWGSLWGQSWNIDKNALEVDFFLIKGIVENLFDRIGIVGAAFSPVELSGFHPTRTAEITLGGTYLGVIGQINPETAASYDIAERVYAFELDFSSVLELSGESRPYKPVSRYPAVTRDLAVVVEDSVSYSSVKQVVTMEGGDLLESASLFDLYAGPPLPPGHKNLAFNIVFRSAQRTLRDEEIDERLTLMKSRLSMELGATFRDT